MAPSLTVYYNEHNTTSSLAGRTFSAFLVPSLDSSQRFPDAENRRRGTERQRQRSSICPVRRPVSSTVHSLAQCLCGRCCSLLSNHNNNNNNNHRHMRTSLSTVQHYYHPSSTLHLHLHHPSAPPSPSQASFQVSPPALAPASPGLVLSAPRL